MPFSRARISSRENARPGSLASSISSAYSIVVSPGRSLADHHLAHLWVQREPLEAPHGVGVVGLARGGRAVTLDVRLQPRDELARLERLRQVVVRAELQPDDAVGGLPAGGQHDDRHVAALANAPADGEAVHLRQHDVEDDGVEVPALERGEPGARRRRRDDAEREAFAVLGQHLAEAFVVVDQEDIVHGEGG